MQMNANITPSISSSSSITSSTSKSKSAEAALAAGQPSPSKTTRHFPMFSRFTKTTATSPPQPPVQMATIRETFGFILDGGYGTRGLFFAGCLGSVGSGLVFPILASLFPAAFSAITGSGSRSGLDDIRSMSHKFMLVGVYALFMSSVQAACIETAAARATQTFRLQWFQALLRQDIAFFDVYATSEISTTLGPQANLYRRGIGRKFGESIQYATTFIGGITYAFFSSWKVASVIISALPIVSMALYLSILYNQNVTANASQAYAKAASVALSTISAIRTVLSLNAVPEMIRQYSDATLEAYTVTVRILWKQGLANGIMQGAFKLLNFILTLYGASLVYKEVEATGCNPSGGQFGNSACEESGPAVFGAMLGIAFAATGISQLTSAIEAFTAARIAAYRALQCIHRVPGAPQETLFHNADEVETLDLTSVDEDNPDADIEASKCGKVRAVMPSYQIDSLSDSGLKLKSTKGGIAFKNVTFSYPTRPDNIILNDFNLTIESGKTVALVGSSGGGKSTIAALIERFYDPTFGSIHLDGEDLQTLNVHHLRQSIGYVGQEPILFATTIAENIRNGNPRATQEDIYEAARLANADTFIQSFPNGYDTKVGDNGAQLSGGQKQRIAIARVLVSKPSIFLFDEATSALDAESEVAVQEAVDNVVSDCKRTTIVIAHRLSTIRNADSIVVVSHGRVVEQGSHTELMASTVGAYRNLVEKQSSSSTRRQLSLRKSVMGDRDGQRSSMDGGSAEIDSIQMRFDKVDFSYPSRPGRVVLNEFKLNIYEGETVALVGPSGGGKSTVVSLIERFYDASEGTIEFRGRDIRGLNPKWYRSQIGYVGQEPTLFDTTIANNIAYGFYGATQSDIEEAAKQANAHDFIMTFPDAYNTFVGEKGTQLSGGQKQRVAIARALVKKPKILLLDEATSALDSESESVVQDALDRVMTSGNHTTIVIAHRLSTIHDVDSIAYIDQGKVIEYGSHETLMNRTNGRYRRLVETQSGTKPMLPNSSSSIGSSVIYEDSDKEESQEDISEKMDTNAFVVSRARKLAAPDAGYLLYGACGAMVAGSIFPAWGVLFAKTIEMLFTVVVVCNDDFLAKSGFESCPDYWESVADSMQQRSFRLGSYWILLAVAFVVGTLAYMVGFGYASERLNKRLRDRTFAALIRQEVAYFDVRSTSIIASQLQEDTTSIHTFSGEPVRVIVFACSSVFTGMIVAFSSMWQFALLSMVTIPFMAFSSTRTVKAKIGQDEGDANAPDPSGSPGAIVTETLTNIRTVAALTMEKAQFEKYKDALQSSEESFYLTALKHGLTNGSSVFIQQWVHALHIWWGGYILSLHPDTYTFSDLLTSMFAMMFSLFGLGNAFQNLSDRSKTEKSARRILHILDRKSLIDPLTDDGDKLD